MSKCQLCKLLWSGGQVTENTMEMMLVLCILFTLFAVSCQNPFVFEDKVDICSYPSSNKNKKIEMTSNPNTIKLADIDMEIHFKVCGRFLNKNHLCPVGTSACLKSKTGSKLVLGTEFISDKNYNFRSINGDACSKSKNYSMVVSLQCSLEVDSYLMYIEENCTYHIGMRDPRCLPQCTTYIDGKFIDLRDLGRSFLLNTPERNFSLTLCDQDPLCNETDVNACEIIGDRKTPVSLASSLYVSYVGQKNQLSFHGVTYKGENGKVDKKFEVILKCDWDKKDINNEDLKYVKKRTQGRKYTFELETSFGCIKKPVPCVVHDQFLIYNLSNLYNEHQEMWSTNGGSKNSDSIYFLQVCGPGELAGKNTSCKSTYAQVCENRNGIDINRGSVLQHLEVINDVIKATIEISEIPVVSLEFATPCTDTYNKSTESKFKNRTYSFLLTLPQQPAPPADSWKGGMQCKGNPDVQYQTFIDFYCGEHEHGPKFLKETDCDTYFTWSTPQACPKYNTSSCSHIHEDQHSCLFQKGNNYYNLSQLTKTQKSIRNGNKLFLFNICGPVIDSDAPCMKDVSVAVKNLTEVNPKNKIKSLGKFSGTSVENGSLVLEYATGSFCNGTDYTSKIRFECSILQEEPVIIKQEKCFYEILWRTEYACPEKRPTDIKNCTYIDNYNNKSIDFSHIQHTSIKLDDVKFFLTFDICHQNYTNCTHDNQDCHSVPMNRTVVESFHNFTSLEFTLPIECEKIDDINKVNFRFICDEIQNIDHINSLETINCTLVINYFTNLVCSLKNNNYIPIGHIKQLEHEVPPTVSNLSQQNQQQQQTTKECFTKSPFTNEELNIRNLTLKLDFFNNKCPLMIFNDTYRFVKLLYITTDICHPSPSKNLSYEVYLKCTNDIVLPAMNDECLQHYNDYENLDYCNYFKSPSQYSLSTESIIGLIVGIILIVVVISAMTFVAIKKNICRRNRQYEGFLSIYQKDTEL